MYIKKGVAAEESLLKHIIESMPDALICCNDKGEIVYANYRACVLFGYLLEELMGIKIENLMPERLESINPQHREQYFANPVNRSMGVLSTDMFGIKKDGSEFACDISLNSMDTFQGKIVIYAIRDITEKKKIEKRLKESEAMKNGILSSLTANIAVMDADGIILATNNAWDEATKWNKKSTLKRMAMGSNCIIEYTRDKAKGNHYAEKVLEGIDKVFKKQIPIFELSYPFSLHDDERWFRLRIMRFDSDTSKIVMSHSDISEIVKSNRLVETSELKYKNLIEVTNEMICIISFDGSILFSNNAFKENLQYSDDELKNIKITDILAEDAKTGFQNRMIKLHAGERINNFTVTLFSKNGDLVYLDGLSIPLFENGEITGTQGFFRNVTDKKKTEKELATALTQIKHVFNSFENSFWARDFANNKIIYVSPGNEKVTGYPTDAFFKDPDFWVGLIIAEDKEHFKTAYPRLSEGKNVSIEYRIRHADSTIHWIESRMTPTLDENGNLVRVDGISVDITDRKNAREKLETQNNELKKIHAELDFFVNSASKDLITPLKAILGIVDVIKEESKEQNTVKNAEMLDSQIQQLDEKIKKILKLFKEQEA